MAVLSWSEQAVFDIDRTLTDIERTSPAFATICAIMVGAKLGMSFGYFTK